MTRLLKSIFQHLYPYATFRTGREPSANNQTGSLKDRTRTVYLTFDDGPIPEVTPQVLAILDRYGIKATFFMVGENIDKHPDVFAQVVAAGHSVGNHTYNHLKGWHTPIDEYMANVARCQKAIITHQTSFRIPTLFRPPYGKATLRQRFALHQEGYQLIYWDVLTRDYDASVTPDQIMATVRRETRPGSIINFHDSIKSADRTLVVLPRVIDYLLSEGYTFSAL